MNCPPKSSSEQIRNWIRKVVSAIYCESEKPKQGYLVTQQDADFVVTRLKGIDTMFLKISAYILYYLLGQLERSLGE